MQPRARILAVHVKRQPTTTAEFLPRQASVTRRERRRRDLNLFHRLTVRKEAAKSERLKQNFEIIMVETRKHGNKRI